MFDIHDILGFCSTSVFRILVVITLTDLSFHCYSYYYFDISSDSFDQTLDILNTGLVNHFIVTLHLGINGNC
jgi:hypothetical protein